MIQKKPFKMRNLEDRVSLDKLEILRDIEETKSYRKWGHKSLIEYLVIELGFSLSLAKEQVEELDVYQNKKLH
jgi:hypothetical protein